MRNWWTSLTAEGGLLSSLPLQLSSLLPTLLRLLLILLLAKLALTFGLSLVKRLFATDRRHLKIDPKKARTTEALIKSVLRYLVYFIAAITILSELGIRTDSLLASAGIVGLAVGFGAQSLVRDVLTGLFIIFEDQFSVGDYVEIGGAVGFVEEIGLRVSKLRDFSGVVHILPNGEIGKVTNHSRGDRSATVDIAVPHDQNAQRVKTVLEQSMADLAKRQLKIVEGPTVLGLVELGTSGMVFRIIAKTVPLEQWSIERLIRQEISLVFQQEQIPIYYSHIVSLLDKQKKE